MHVPLARYLDHRAESFSKKGWCPMRTKTRLKLSMAVSARDFATTHPVADAGFDTALKRLDDSITQADAMAMQQVQGERDEKAARARRRDGIPNIRNGQLRRLIRIAEVALETHPELKGQFSSPASNLTTKGFLVAARSLIGAATEYQDALLAAGMTTTFIAEFTQSLDNLETETESSHTGRTDHVAASADLENLARACVRDVDLIGTYYVATLAKKSDEMMAWESASKVRSNKRRADVPPEPAPEPEPEPQMLTENIEKAR
jgi:hypothetical protein